MNNVSFMDSGVRILFSFSCICTIRLALAGVYREQIADILPKPILGRILSPKWLPEAKVRKLHENIFYSIWHTFSFFAVLSHVTKEAWFVEMFELRDPRHILSGWPHFVDKDVQWTYIVELSFWLASLTFMAVETTRKDARELFIHHIATITLVSMSYLYSYFRIGFVVMLIHDIGDIFLYSAKSFHYLGMKRITNVLFISFVIAFVIFRLLVFPMVIRAAWGCATGYLNIDTDMPGCYILPTMLSVLQLLHWMWFILIIRMLYRMAFIKNEVEGDIRSDDETEEVAHNIPQNGGARGS